MLVRLNFLTVQVSAVVFNPRREGRGETRPSQIVVVAAPIPREGKMRRAISVRCRRSSAPEREGPTGRCRDPQRRSQEGVLMR